METFEPACGYVLVEKVVKEVADNNKLLILPTEDTSLVARCIVVKVNNSSINNEDYSEGDVVAVNAECLENTINLNDKTYSIIETIEILGRVIG